MATLYWGGGSGTWDGFTTSNWYTDFARLTLSTRAPSAEDDVIFDSASNATAYTVTISNSTTVCRNVTIAGPATGNVTLAGSGAWYIYGNLTFPATRLTYSYSGSITFYGTGSQTITSNAVTFLTVTFAGTGTYTLQDAFTSGTTNFNAGTFVTNNNNLTCSAITATAGTTAGTINLGSSTVSAGAINTNSPLTINAGTSNITLTGTSVFIGTGVNYTGNTFYNVTYSSTAITNAGYYGNNTFNNLTFAAKSTATVSNILLAGNQTVTGTLTVAGQLSVRRYFVQSNIVGTPRTLTVGTVASLVDVDFRDITVAGASSPWSGTRLGDCLGNTNITFPAAKTVYWNQVGGGNWYDTAWATSSGGTVNSANFPLAQDTAIIDNTGLTVGSTIGGVVTYNLKTLTSTKNNAYTIQTSFILYGDLTQTAGISQASANFTFAGRSTQTLTSAGNSMNSITIQNYNTSVFLADDLTLSNILTITSGGLNTNSKTVTLSAGVAFSTTNTGPFTLTLGSSAISVSSSSSIASTSALTPTMTVSAGTSSITLTSGSAPFGFVGQTLNWNNVTWSSPTAAIQIYGNNTFNNLTFTSPVTTNVVAINVYGNQTVTGTLAFGGGLSVTQRMAFFSDTAGTQRTITAATVTGLSDIDFKDIAVAGASSPWSGTRLGNCLGNSNITFVAGTNKYWNLTGTQNWSANAWATSSGGTPSTNNFPLAQDTAVFDDTGVANTVTLDVAWNIGSINASARTNAMTLAGTTGASIYGNITYGSGITSTATGTFVFRGTSTQTFTTAGKSLANPITIASPSCVFRHGDAYTSTSSITLSSGSYSTQNYNISISALNSTGSITRSIDLGTSTVTMTGIGPVNFTISTGLTFTGASSTINLSTTSAKTFSGGGQTFGTVSSTGGTTSALTISGSNTFGTLTNSARTYMIWTAGTTQTITNFTYSGVSGTVVRWYTSIAGQRSTIKQSSTGGSLAAVGTNSTDGGNNSGLTFTGSSPNYFYVKDIAYSASYNGAPNFFSFF